MSTPASAAPTVLLDADQIAARCGGSRTRSSSARASRSTDARARRHLHARRRARAAAATLLAEIGGVELPVGALDITFYRDDVGPARRRDARASAAGRQGLVARLPARRRAPSCSSTTCSTPAAPCAPRSRRSSTTAARAGPARRALRPRASRAADPRRLRRQEPADLARRARRACAWSRSTRSRTSCSRGEPDGRRSAARRRDAAAPPPALARAISTAATIERLLDLAASFEAVAEREVKKLPTLRGRTVVNVFFEASTRTSSSFELAAKRLSADTMSLKASRLVGRQGRVAQGHDPDARRATGRTSSSSATRRSGAARFVDALHPRRGRQRRRRQAPAPDAEPARPLHDPRGARPARGPARRDRRRRAALARGPLEHHRASRAAARTSRSSGRRR